MFLVQNVYFTFAEHDEKMPEKQKQKNNSPKFKNLLDVFIYDVFLVFFFCSSYDQLDKEHSSSERG